MWNFCRYSALGTVLVTSGLIASIVQRLLNRVNNVHVSHNSSQYNRNIIFAVQGHKCWLKQSECCIILKQQHLFFCSTMSGSLLVIATNMTMPCWLAWRKRYVWFSHSNIIRKLHVVNLHFHQVALLLFYRWFLTTCYSNLSVCLMISLEIVV